MALFRHSSALWLAENGLGAYMAFQKCQGSKYKKAFLFQLLGGYFRKLQERYSAFARGGYRKTLALWKTACLEKARNYTAKQRV